jgi:hypothetical protein
VNETWVDTEGAEAFIKQLKMRRNAQVEALVGAATTSPDPSVRGSAMALLTLDSVIKDMEAERGSNDD